MTNPPVAATCLLVHDADDDAARSPTPWDTVTAFSQRVGRRVAGQSRQIGRFIVACSSTSLRAAGFSPTSGGDLAQGYHIAARGSSADHHTPAQSRPLTRAAHPARCASDSDGDDQIRAPRGHGGRRAGRAETAPRPPPAGRGRPVPVPRPAVHPPATGTVGPDLVDLQVGVPLPNSWQDLWHRVVTGVDISHPKGGYRVGGPLRDHGCPGNVGEDLDPGRLLSPFAQLSGTSSLRLGWRRCPGKSHALA